MMEEKWERVGEETSLQHMHLKKKQNKKEKWAPRAYLFSSPLWLNMTMVAFNLPSKLSQMVAFNLPSITALCETHPLGWGDVSPGNID
jgi:hypothetical protein